MGVFRINRALAAGLVGSAGFSGAAELPQDADDAAYPAIERFVTALEMVRRQYPEADKVGYERLVNHALEGMMAGLDPFSSFIHPGMAEVAGDGKDALDAGEIGSLGLTFAVREDGAFVAGIAPHGAAAEAGISPGSTLLEINGRKIDAADFRSWIGSLRRAPGETTRLKLKPATGGTEAEIPLVHRAMPLRSLGFSGILGTADGHVRMDLFGRGCAGELEAALDALEEKGMKRLILDLRGNPGGDLGETVRVIGLFVPPETPVVTVNGRGGVQEILKSPGRQRRQRDYPIVVLIDRMSASAAELTAGALQDMKRAIIVGEKSFGKGSVQRIVPMAGGTALRLTIATYHTPSGKTPHRFGILPDVEVRFSAEDRARFSESVRFDSLMPGQREKLAAWKDPGIAAALAVPTKNGK